MSVRLTRRGALKQFAAAGFAAPFVFRKHGHAAPSETLLHASFGADGMGWSDIRSLTTASKNIRLVAVAEVDETRLKKVKDAFPDVRVYTDYRVLLEKEKGLTSVNVSTPDHMHGSMTMAAMNRGLHVYCQKPLTQTLYESRRLTEAAAAKGLITQMGIQVHSAASHKQVVAAIQAGLIGKVKEVHSWSGKQWGDTSPRPNRQDPIPAGFHWDLWLGVASDRPFIGGGYYHPGNWRKRLDFGTGTFGDMGCHILDPVFGALQLTNPLSVRSELPGPNDDNWSLDVKVQYLFPGTTQTTETLTLTWYNGNALPPDDIAKLIAPRKLHNQGSIYIGTEGVLYSPYGGGSGNILLPEDKFPGNKLPTVTADNHYLQFINAVRGEGKTSAPFSYSGPLTEMVLLGCLATRRPKIDLKWDSPNLRFTNDEEANRYVRRQPRKGWEVEGL